MNLWAKAWATVLFDFQRSLTPSRLSVVVVLSLFPPAIMGINLIGDQGREVGPAIIGVTVMMVGILAELLWATPIVYQELEGKTWTYLAVRPFGKLALLCGKYMIAVAWTMFVCSVAMTLSVLLLLRVDILSDHMHTWLVFMFLILMASFAYGAIFLLLGVLFHRRAMVFAMVYVIGLEGFVGQLPAVVNQLSMRHHLMALAVKWLDVPTFLDAAMREPVMREILGMDEADWVNILMLVVTTLVTFALAAWIVRSREYITSEEA